MIDIVIPLSRGSQWRDNELKFCLRSVEKHLSGVDEVVLISSHIPRWVNLDKISWLRMPDDPKGLPNKNILDKLLYYCGQNTQRDEFLFMNDDHFIRQSCSATDYPDYYDRTLLDLHAPIVGQKYADLAFVTMEALADKRKNILNYDVHFPMVMSQKKFIASMNQYDWSGIGLLIKSIYANTLDTHGTQVPDCKIRTPIKTPERIDNITKHSPCFSISDLAVSAGMIKFLNTLYPQKSKYEL